MDLPTADGDYESRQLIEPTKRYFPFLNAPTRDSTTKFFERLYEVDRNSYTPFAPSTTLPAEETGDPADASAKIIKEEFLQPQVDGTQQVRALFGYLPIDQVVTGLYADITKPAFPTNDYSGYFVDSVSVSVTANIWSLFIAAVVARYITGGTFTITYKTSTTGAIAWNAANATIESAVNALADLVSDGFTISVNTAANSLSTTGALSLLQTGGVGILNGSNFTLDASSLTPANIAARPVATSGLVSWAVARSALNFHKVGHGLSAAQPLRTMVGATGGGTLTAVASVVDADNFTVTNASAQPSAFDGYRTFVRDYTPGRGIIRSRETMKFYDDASTIPAAPSLLADADFLAAVLASTTGYVDYAASKATPWQGTSLLALTITALLFDDL